MRGAGVTFGGAKDIGVVTLHVDAGRYVKVSGSDISLTLGGVAVRGGFDFEQSTAADGTKVVTITLNAVTLSLGEGRGNVTLGGTLRAGGTGTAGVLTVAGDIKVPGFSFTGSFELRVNTGTTAVRLADGSTLPAGPYFRFVGLGVVVTLGTDGPTLAGSFSIEQVSNSLGQRRSVLAVAGGTLTLAGSDVLKDVNGVFVLAVDGMAGTLSGRLDVSTLLPTGVTLAGTFGLLVNTTPRRVQESVTLGGTTVALDAPTGRFVRVFGTGVTLGVGGQVLSGDVAIEQSGTGTTARTVLTLANITVRLGTGSSDVLTLTNGNGFLVVTKGTTAATSGMTGSFSGNLTLNVPDVSVGGLFTVDVNTVATALPSTTVSVGGVTKTVTFDGVTRFKVGATGLVLDIAGQKLGGDFTFEQTTTTTSTGTVRKITLTVDHGTLFLGDPGATDELTDDKGVRLTEIHGVALLAPTGVALDLSATFALVGLGSLPVTFAVDGLPVHLQLSTVPTAVKDTALGLDLPAGRFVRVQLGTSAQKLTLTAFGQTLTGVFSIEQATSAGTDGVLGTTDDRKVLKVAATEVGLFLGSGSAGFTITGGSALFLVTPDGMAGRVTGTATLAVPGIVSASATVTAEMNDMRRSVTVSSVTTYTPLAVDETFVVGGAPVRLTLAAGPFLKVSVTGFALSIGGQSLTGDVTILQTKTINATTGVAGTPVTKIVFANVGLRLGSAERDVVVVRNGRGSLDLTAAGVIGRIDADVAVDLPGASVSGTFGLQLDTTTTPTSLTVSGTGVRVDIAGQRLTGSFTFTKVGTTLSLTLTGVTLELGDGTTTFVRAVLGGNVTVAANGVTAELTGSLAFPGLPTSTMKLDAGTVTVAFSTVRTATVTPYVEVRVSGASLSVFGQTVKASLTYKQVTTAAGAKIVKVTLSGVEIFLGDPGTNLTDPADDLGVKISGGSGLLLLTPTGVAAQFSGTVSLTSAMTTTYGVSAGAGLKFQVNTLGTAVNETLPDGTVVALAAGRYMRAFANNLTVTVRGVTFTTDLAIDRVTQTVTTPGAAAGTTITRFAFANATLSSTASGVSGTNPGLTEGSGFLVFYNDGVIGQVSGKAAITVTPFTGSGSVGIRFNTMDIGSTDRTETITVDGTPLTVTIPKNTPAGVAFFVQNLDFSFGDVLEIRAGEFVISGDTFSGSGLEIFIGKGPSKLAGGGLNPDAIGVLITGANLAFRRPASGTGFAMRVSGTFALLGLPGLTVSGGVAFEINTAAQELDPGTPPNPTSAVVPAGLSTGAMLSGRFGFAVTNAVFEVAGVFRLQGSLGLSRQPDGTLDLTLANASVTVTIGGTDVATLRGFGSFSISPTAGFHMNSFKVSGFNLFPTSSSPAITAPGTTSLFPTVDLGTYGPSAKPLRNASLTLANVPTQIEVQLNDVNQVGIREATVIDADAEIEILRNGVVTGTVNGVPTKVVGKPNTWLYSYSGVTFAAGDVVTVRFKAGSFTDESGATNWAEDERFFVVDNTPGSNPNGDPRPIAALANPGNGGAVTASELNQRGYLDVTYTSLDGDPIREAELKTGVPFKISGTGVTADLDRDLQGHPNIVGTPLLVSGFGPKATTRTYRYFLKDSAPGNATGIFAAGGVTLTFDGVWYSDGSAGTPVSTKGVGGVLGSIQALGSSYTTTQSFTVDPNAPGAVAATNPRSLGPLTLQGPSVGIADFGFADGMVVLTLVHRPRPGFPRLRRHADHAGYDDQPGQPGQRRPARHPGHLRPRRRRVRPAQRQRPDPAHRQVGSARRLADGARPRRRRPDRVRHRGGLRPEGRGRPDAGLDQQRDHHLPALQPDRHAAALQPDHEDQRDRRRRRQARRRCHTRPGRARQRLQPRHRGAALRRRAQPAGRRPDQPDPEPADLARRNRGVRRPPGRRQRPHRELRQRQPPGRLHGRGLLRHRWCTPLPGQGLRRDDPRPHHRGRPAAGRLGGRRGAAHRRHVQRGTGRTPSSSTSTPSRCGSAPTSPCRRATCTSTPARPAPPTSCSRSPRSAPRSRSVPSCSPARPATSPSSATASSSRSAGSGSSSRSARPRATRSSGPTFLPVRIDSIGIEWADVSNHPEDFVLILCASVTGIKGLGGLEFSGSVQGIRIAAGAARRRASSRSSASTRSASPSRARCSAATIDAGLIGGILKLDVRLPDHRRPSTTRPRCSSGSSTSASRAASRWPAWPASRSASVSPSSARSRCSSTSSCPAASCSSPTPD